MPKFTGNQILTKLALAGVAVLAVGLVPNWEHQLTSLHKLQVLGKDRGAQVDVHAAPELAAYVEQPQISAREALAYDFQSGSILFTHNFDERTPIASLTKIVTTLVILDSGKVNDIVEIQEVDTKIIGANTGLVVGERIAVTELLKAMLIASHNDATIALARHVGGTQENFVRLMNQKAADLGMQNTHFVNPVGLDEPGAYSTAQDLVLALRPFLANEHIARIVRTKETEIKAQNLAFAHKIKTTNKLLLEDESIVGVKTGYTTEAKGNLVIRSIKDKADVIVIVLGSDDREADSRKILDWVTTVYRW